MHAHSLQEVLECLQKIDYIDIHHNATMSEILLGRAIAQKFGIKITSQCAKKFQDFVLGIVNISQKPYIYTDNFGTDELALCANNTHIIDEKLENIDGVVVFGGIARRIAGGIDCGLNYVIKSEADKTFVIYPMLDSSYTYPQIQYEVGTELGVSVLLLKWLITQKPDEWLATMLDSVLREIDIGYIASECNVAEEELDRLSDFLSHCTSPVLLVTDVIFYHPKSKEIAQILGILERYSHIRICVLPTFKNDIQITKFCHLDEASKNHNNDKCIKYIGIGDFGKRAKHYAEKNMEKNIENMEDVEWYLEGKLVGYIESKDCVDSMRDSTQNQNLNPMQDTLHTQITLNTPITIHLHKHKYSTTLGEFLAVLAVPAGLDGFDDKLSDLLDINLLSSTSSLHALSPYASSPHTSSSSASSQAKEQNHAIKESFEVIMQNLQEIPENNGAMIFLTHIAPNILESSQNCHNPKDANQSLAQDMDKNMDKNCVESKLFVSKQFLLATRLTHNAIIKLKVYHQTLLCRIELVESIKGVIGILYTRKVFAKYPFVKADFEIIESKILTQNLNPNKNTNKISNENPKRNLTKHNPSGES